MLQEKKPKSDTYFLLLPPLNIDFTNGKRKSNTDLLLMLLIMIF